MKIKELREKSIQELHQTEHLYKEELFNLKMQAASNQLEKPSRIQFLRRGIARIKTLLQEDRIANPEQEAKKVTKAKVKKEKTK